MRRPAAWYRYRKHHTETQAQEIAPGIGEFYPKRVHCLFACYWNVFFRTENMNLDAQAAFVSILNPQAARKPAQKPAKH